MLLHVVELHTGVLYTEHSKGCCSAQQYSTQWAATAPPLGVSGLMWAVDRGETHSWAKDTLQNLALKDWIWIKRSLAERLKWCSRYAGSWHTWKLTLSCCQSLSELNQCGMNRAAINMESLNYNENDFSGIKFQNHKPQQTLETNG